MNIMGGTSAEGRVTYKKLRQTAGTLWPCGSDFSVEVESLEKILINLQELTFTQKKRKQDSTVGNSIT